MAFYADEEEVWKCPKHPSKRRRNGICPVCLRDRLITLCPDCANVRPCACCAAVRAPSSLSPSSSFSVFSSSGGDGRSACVGTIGRVSRLIDNEHSFRRSRSVAIPFLRSRFAGDRDSGSSRLPTPGNRGKSSFWSLFKTHKNEKCKVAEAEEVRRNQVETEEDYVQRMLMRSRSMSVAAASDSGAGHFRSSSTKKRGWYFPSPIKAFRHSRTPKVAQERSPLYRG